MLVTFCFTLFSYPTTYSTLLFSDSFPNTSSSCPSSDAILLETAYAYIGTQMSDSFSGDFSLFPSFPDVSSSDDKSVVSPTSELENTTSYFITCIKSKLIFLTFIDTNSAQTLIISPILFSLATVGAQSVRAFTLHAEGWVFESQPGQILIVKAGIDSSIVNRSATVVSATGHLPS